MCAWFNIPLKRLISWQFLSFIIIVAALLVPAAVSAQGGPKLEPASLEFIVYTGENLTRFTTLTTPVEFADLTVTNNGLVNDEKTAVIPPDKIIVSPAAGKIPAGQQRFAVTIQQPELPGHYRGDLQLRMGMTNTVQSLTLTLDVTVVAKPLVSASAASTNQVLHLVYQGQGSPTGSEQSAPNHIFITLEQAGRGSAILTGVKIDPLRSASASLPGELLVVSPAISATLPLSTTAGSVDLTVRANAASIPPGEYQTGLRVTVAGQAEPVKVPFKVQSKALLIWPVVLAGVGMLFGFLSYYINQKINPTSKLVEKVKKIQTTLDEHQVLQAEDIEELGMMLKSIQERIFAGEEAATLETLLDELATRIKARQEENRKFILPEGEPAKAVQELHALEVGVKVAAEIVDSLNALKNRVARGGFRNMDDAQFELQAINAQRDRLKDVSDNFLKVKKLVEEDKDHPEPLVDIDALKRRLNQAENIDTLMIEVKNALKLYQPEPKKPVEDISYAEAGVDNLETLREMREAQDVPARWNAFTSELKAQRWLLILATTLFALAGGVMALYVPNPTWGASINDYVTLLIWALSVNIIAGQQVDFKAYLKPPASS